MALPTACGLWVRLGSCGTVPNHYSNWPLAFGAFSADVGWHFEQCRCGRKRISSLFGTINKYSNTSLLITGSDQKKADIRYTFCSMGTETKAKAGCLLIVV
jgi:hypothetical protein